MKLLPRLFANVAAIAVLVMMVALTYGTVARYVFGSPVSWPGVITGGLLLPAVIALPLWYVASIERHVRIDFVANRLSPRFRRWLEPAISLAEVGLWLLVTGALVRGFVQYLDHAPAVGRFAIPRYVTVAILTLGCLGMAVRSGQELWGTLRHNEPDRSVR